MVLEEGKGLLRVAVGGARQMSTPMVTTCNWTMDSETVHHEWKWEVGIGQSRKLPGKQILPCG